ncbi:DUF1836 domain-containing protein [Streptococcus panodentis]|uniref:DUF1836 domain-containing protein n=1 Tax=Streptococcus panodentis TaxID=1581472 RepID=A0ABS5B041_9STRE|nr:MULTISPECIES: DUF1836 domain-containing protein [Streptococcus]KXT83816.1 hypothetical protein STRDD11_01270 [Streptococcus sp. DD11]MBP2622199.1 hypothetical protein [Streptococcus panodentis]
MNAQHPFPKWDELPDLDLYLDQVLLYVNNVCGPSISASDKGLTASMINNYVKHGYVAKPVKKKYQRRQVARLIAITTLKTVFSIQEISATLNMLHEETDSTELYNEFVAYMNGEQREVTPIIARACQTVKLYQETLALIQLPEKEEEHLELRA